MEDAHARTEYVQIERRVKSLEDDFKGISKAMGGLEFGQKSLQGEVRHMCEQVTRTEVQLNSGIKQNTDDIKSLSKDIRDLLDFKAVESGKEKGAEKNQQNTFDWMKFIHALVTVVIAIVLFVRTGH